jgi:hypothetical protein
MSFSLAGLIVVVLLGLYSFFKVDRTKTTAWMVVNVVFLAACGFLCVSHVNLYLFAGIAAAVVNAVVSLFGGGASVSTVVSEAPSFLSNLMTYVKSFFVMVFFWPVKVFEMVYGALKSKV